jgi:hypothetical protein
MTYLYGKNSVLSTDWSKRLDRMENGLPQPLGWLPMSNHHNFNFTPSKVKKLNRYLRFMNKRILKYLYSDKAKAISIWCIMLRISLAYQLVLFHKSKSDWYWSVPEENVIKEFTKLRNRLRSGSLKMEIKRYYIEKKPELNLEEYAKRFRPIGAPGWASKAISKGITEMVAHITQDIQPEFQHAYRYNKGLGSAVLDIINYINKGYVHVIEFDLKGFFNNVRYQDIKEYLEKISPKLYSVVINAIAKINYSCERYKTQEVWTAKEIGKRSDYTDAITHYWRNYNLKFFNHKKTWFEPQLKAEDELILDPTKPMTIARSGMPQGLGFSAIVATVCNPLNKFKIKKVLFSDDGILLFKNPEERDKTHLDLRSWYQRGVLISWPKTKLVRTQFRFLGLLFDIGHRIIYFDQGAKIGWKTPVIRFNDPNLKQWLEKVVTLYMKQPKKWTWLIKRDSFVMRTRWNISIKTRILTLIKGIFFGERYKNYRAIYVYGMYWKIVDISRSSTYCMDILIQRVGNRKYKKVKNLQLDDINFDLPNSTLMRKRGLMNGTIYRDYLYDKTQTNDNNYDKMVILSSNLENLKEWGMSFPKWCKFMNDPQNTSAVDEFICERKKFLSRNYYE